ncbi:hypothetical protein LINGRAHAP2_LOCUS1693, partial [Linum grandiflorum]
RISDFLDFIDLLQLLDIRFCGDPFTWSNRHTDLSTLVDERLDRFLLNEQWLTQWPEAVVCHLLPLSSHHAPIVLTLAIPPACCGRLFHFDYRWADNPKISLLVGHFWFVKVLHCHKVKDLKACLV